MAVPEGGLCVMVRLVAQLSVATTSLVTSGMVAWQPRTVRLVGQMMRAGGWVSAIMTLKLQVFVLPWKSVMVEVIRFVPTGKVEPLGGVEVTLVMMQPSATGKAKDTFDLLHWPGSALAVMLVGQ